MKYELLAPAIVHPVETPINFLRHGWAPSNYRSRPLPPDRIECWQPGEHWTEKGQACHDRRDEREGNKELP